MLKFGGFIYESDKIHKLATGSLVNFALDSGWKNGYNMVTKVTTGSFCVSQLCDMTE
jgi:hypothetical protein